MTTAVSNGLKCKRIARCSLTSGKKIEMTKAMTETRIADAKDNATDALIINYRKGGEELAPPSIWICPDFN